MRKIAILLALVLITNIFYISVESRTLQIDTFPESYVIKDVEFISQETTFYCLFTSPTMVINYKQIKTSQKEVLFNSGVGYSTIYCDPLYDSVPMGGNGAACLKLDREFLGKMYGLDYIESAISLENNDCWDVFFSQLKENITNNIPVFIKADPLFMPSFLNPIFKELGLNLPEGFCKLFQLVPPGFFHVMLIVGYDDVNETIYFHDGLADVFNHPEEGTYAEISYEIFKIALTRASDNSQLVLGSFKDNEKEPISKKQAFIKAHSRNIEKMKGNLSVYDDDIVITEPCKYGINALYQLNEDMTGFKNQLFTAIAYRHDNFKHLNPFYSALLHLSDRFTPTIFTMPDWQAFSNYYYQFAIEKLNMSQYLEDMSLVFEDEELINLCKFESELLRQESEKWYNLSQYFHVFMKRGIFISLPRSLIIINKMKTLVEEIIIIQEKIIDGANYLYNKL